MYTIGIGFTGGNVIYYSFMATGTQSGDSFYATILTFSMIVVVVTAPALGVIADKMPIKKKLLKWYTAFGGGLVLSFVL